MCESPEEPHSCQPHLPDMLPAGVACSRCAGCDLWQQKSLTTPRTLAARQGLLWQLGRLSGSTKFWAFGILFINVLGLHACLVHDALPCAWEVQWPLTFPWHSSHSQMQIANACPYVLYTLCTCRAADRQLHEYMNTVRDCNKWQVKRKMKRFIPIRMKNLHHQFP
jgi:hypothetical protein